AIFSMIDAALLKSLPVRDANGLMVFRWSAHKDAKHLSITSYGDCGRVGGPKNPGGCSLSGPFFGEMQRHREIFSSVAAFAGGSQLDLSANGEAEIVRRPEYVSGDYFQTLGIVPAAGRLIATGDEDASSPPVIVLSHSYWRSQFHGDFASIGKTVLLNKVACTIVGVAEPRLDSLSPGNIIDMWLPLSAIGKLQQPWDNREVNPAYFWLVLMARLQSGVTRERAQAAGNTIFVNQTTNGEKPLFKSGDGQSIRLVPAQEGF